ncbi:universal stress protein [Aquabacterium sp.]|uniref:universal stress protein n=1 Tax=Aquabacterium sp. TaxID=1872578 RepID=UPI003BB07E34
MFKHLFVPVDGSDLSHRAMDGSIALAKQLGAAITGFVVEPDMPISIKSNNPSTFLKNIEDHESKNKSHANALLGQFEVRAKEAGVSFKGNAVTAYAVDHAILEEATKAGCDLIVMVTHARGHLAELITGSHTKNVISHGRIPVLVLY